MFFLNENRYSLPLKDGGAVVFRICDVKNVTPDKQNNQTIIKLWYDREYIVTGVYSRWLFEGQIEKYRMNDIGDTMQYPIFSI